MKNALEINEEAFDKFLSWLNPNRELAAEKYEAIRLRLTKIFQYRGIHQPEELVDETFDRVIKKIHFLIETYEGDPIFYFFGVANNVFHEHLKKPRFEEIPQELKQKEITEKETTLEFECLEKCLKNLSEEQRNFILGYYQENKQAKIDTRKILAENEGIGSIGGRVKAFRIRVKLQKCVFECLGRKSE